MPTRVTDEPLGLSCVFSDGSRAEFDLAGLPNPGLARDLAVGLVELIHPHGSADSAGTVEGYARALRAMVRVLAEQGFTGGAGELRRGQLAQFWMAGPRRLEALTRALVEGFARSGGSLGDGVLELAAGRHFNLQPFRRPLPPYPEVEWQRLITACRQVVDESYAAHRRALAAIEQGSDPRESGWTWENFCWLLARLGPVSTPVFARAIGVTHSVFHNRRPPAFYDALRALFPHLDGVIAYRLLFGVYSGIVPDGIADLGVDDIEWAGDSTVLLSYVKRRTAAESLNLPRPAVRLLEQWLSHSSLLRGLVAPADRDRLWLGLSFVGKPFLIREIDRVGIQRWVGRHGLLGADDPLRNEIGKRIMQAQGMGDQFTLTPGDVRFDSAGGQVAAVGAVPELLFAESPARLGVSLPPSSTPPRRVWESPLLRSGFWSESNDVRHSAVGRAPGRDEGLDHWSKVGEIAEGRWWGGPLHAQRMQQGPQTKRSAALVLA